MKKTLCLLITLILMISLCSCTLEPQTDIIGFCRRVNKCSDTVTLDSSAFYCVSENEYCLFCEIGSRSCILILETDEKGCVNGFRLSLTDGGTPTDGKTQTEIYEYYCLLCSVLSCEDVSQIKNFFSENSFDESKITFSDNCAELEDERLEYFIFSNNSIISLYCVLT